ncbi:GvpL/GvpF family gas vesicle protein [Mycolicibacterium goodii]|uniref:GvpL/GvpF family gas vesicle protein n=1 Tax=Mycolicibacterium goodii TaxID=134601 RepID=UPI001BDCAEF2|nr:GvpL/GvpF family gas vesicle protein [Mycolicibacterium goodii]MBU8819366.1 GvpL/GvpF family gas vesicle protein [Mycolicibacterium goodii]
MSEHSVYLYAVGDAAIADSLGEIIGVDDVPVRAVVEGPLAAIVASVDREEFSEQSIRSHLEDLVWLEKLARAHHAVVDLLAREHSIAPVRMATVYHEDGGVRDLLRNRGDELAETLDRVRGRSEWGVKGYAAPDDAMADTDPSDVPSDKPGTSYLMRRRAERTRAARRREHVTEAADKLHHELAGLAVDHRLYPPQDPRLTGRRDEMVLNAAYLVDDDGAERLAQRVDAANGEELRLEVTGPWAPYSFTSLEQR